MNDWLVIMESSIYHQISKKRMDIKEVLNCQKNIIYIGKITVDVFIQKVKRGKTVKNFKNKNILIIMLSIFFIGCQIISSKEKVSTAQIFAMNTVIDLTVYGEDGEAAIKESKEIIYRLEKLFSVNEPSSEISKINDSAGKLQTVSYDTSSIIKKSINISERTLGLFDISIYPVVKAWGFTTDEFHVPSYIERKKLCEKVNYKKINCKNNNIFIDEGMSIDLGGIAKGYASNCIIQMLCERGISSAIVSLGGNIEVLGKKPDGNSYVVGIKNPISEGELLGTIAVENKAVVTSGSYERFFKKDGMTYHHIMDKRTGAPAESDLLSVTVVANDAALADGLSTALFIMGSEEAIRRQKEEKDFEMILMKKNGDIFVSNKLKLERKK